MLRRNIVGLMVCVAAFGVATGFAGIPDLNFSTAATAATEQVSVFSLPDASGARIDAARTISAAIMDATITVTVLDGNEDPVFLFPAEDVWLETSLGGMVKCPNGTAADFLTNINGVTIFNAAVNVSGASDRDAGEKTVVYINGAPLVGSDLDILFNSADMFIDGVVDLSDLVEFVPSLAASAPYNYAADFYFDGNVDLSDLVLFAGGIGAECP